MFYAVVGISNKYYSFLFICPVRHCYCGHLIHRPILNPFCLFFTSVPCSQSMTCINSNLYAIAYSLRIQKLSTGNSLYDGRAVKLKIHINSFFPFFYLKGNVCPHPVLSLSYTLQVTVTKLSGSLPARVCVHTSVFTSLHRHTCQTHQVSCIYCLPSHASTETPTCCICTARPGSGPILCCADQLHPASLKEASRLHSH